MRRRIGKAKSARYARQAVTPHQSRRIYLRIAPPQTAFFKFTLEACDNLAYLSVVDKYAGIFQLVHSPGNEQEVRQFLDSMRDVTDFTEIALSPTESHS